MRVDYRKFKDVTLISIPTCKHFVCIDVCIHTVTLMEI